MTIKRHIFDVEYCDDPAAIPRIFRCRVLMTDKLQVEENGHKFGIMSPAQQPQLVGLVWLWFAALREGHIPAETTLVEFRARCLDNALVGDQPVDPTQPGASDVPLSTSPGTSPASPTPSGYGPTNV